MCYLFVLAGLLSIISSASMVFAFQGASQIYKVSFTIPVSVTQELNSKSITMRENMVTEQIENRNGALVKVISIVVP